MALKLKPLAKPSLNGAAKAPNATTRAAVEEARVKVNTADGAKQRVVAEVAEEPERAVKSVTVRLASGHLDKLEALQDRLECDRSEVIKRCIRLGYSAFMPNEASLVTMEDGEKAVQPLVMRGAVV